MSVFCQNPIKQDEVIKVTKTCIFFFFLHSSSFWQEVKLLEPQIQEQEKKNCPPSLVPHPEENNVVVKPALEEAAPALDSASLSFAPEGFLFQPPAGLSSFRFEPLTPRSADAFLTPRYVTMGIVYSDKWSH